MDKKKIEIQINEIENVVHISDIHIRNLKRHREYNKVFNTLYPKLRNIKKKNKNCVICITGDIAHAKTDISPELVNIIQDFLKKLANIFPVILIAGNHDCNLNNANRLDALYPIVSAIDDPNIIYLRDSGIYTIANIDFVVMSVFDEPENYIRANQFDSENIKIALFHGIVDNTMNDFGYNFTNKKVTRDIFENYDIAMCGDLHRPQYMNKEKTIAYCGSAIQQGHGELKTGHGMLYWDIKTKKSEFIEIPNEYGYHTVEIDDGKILTDLAEISPYPRIRIKSRNTKNSTVNNVIKDLKKKYKIQELTTQKVVDSTDEELNKIAIGDVREIEYQNKLIRDYLSTKYIINDDVIDVVCDINSNINSRITGLDVLKNVIWKPKLFEFSNMFSYGVHNKIDFSDMNGIYGLLAKNHSGKSAAIDALSFCIFDKCSRTSKASDVLNNKKSKFTSKVNFEIAGKDYFIERTGVKDGKTGHVKVNVDFYTFDDNGNRKSLNGKQRSDTNFAIRSHVGTYDDFVLTSLSLQNNNTGFIDITQKERKELLSQFLDINVFEELYEIANNDFKEIGTLLREYKKEDYSTILSKAESDIEIYTKELDIKKLLYEYKKWVLNSINQRILKLTQKLKKVDPNAVNLDINQLLLDKKKILDEINDLREKLKNSNEKIYDTNLEIDNMSVKLNEYNIEQLKIKLNEYESIKQKKNKIDVKVESIKKDLQHKIEKIEKLGDLEYDPNCTYCMNNIFVKDAIKTKEQINDDKKIAVDLSIEKKDILAEIKSYSDHENTLNEYNNLASDKSNRVSSLMLEERKNSNIKESIKDKESALSNTYQDIKTYITNLDNINHNKTINELLQLVKKSFQIVDDHINKLINEINDVNSKIKVEQMRVDTINEKIDKIKELEKRYEGYDYYINCVKRNGIPYELISKVLPKIEYEINNILNQIVEFNIKLSTDGKNINAYIIYDADNMWPLSLTSGMEKFISSIAIRSALISVTSLPRPSFLVIDEGLGQLDSTHFNSMYLLFDYLKSQFDFVIVISHIDKTRDLVEKFIDITVKNGYSSMNA